jgi:hypothetical protein
MSIQPGKARIALFGVALAAFTAGTLWLWGFPPRVVGNDTGEFQLVAAADKSFDGAPALALTFTLPLDTRKSYDRFIQLFEMPAATPERGQAEPGDHDDLPRAGRGASTVVSVKPEDTLTDGGRVITGAWTVGENPRLLFFPNIKPVTR